jgi:site-specific recombinase XerC
MTTMMNAALPASTTLAPTSAAPALPAGLTDVDAARITAAIAAARTESTRTVYAQAWSQWERWCAARGIPALPGDPLALCAYLTERAEAGKATGTLDMSCTAIRHVHRMCDVEDPVAAEAVRQVRRGLMRTYGAAPRRLARPLTVEEIRQILAGIDRSTLIGIRDAAIILLGYASALRRAEIVALTLADVEHKPAGLLLNIRKSKMDQEGHGQLVAVAHGQHAMTDPVAALGAWRTVRGGTAGALFTRTGPARSASNQSPGTSSPACSAPAPRPPDSTAPGSRPTRYAPATQPPQPWRASRATGSQPRHGTRTSPCWSTATSARWKHSRTRRARTSGSNPPIGSCAIVQHRGGTREGGMPPARIAACECVSSASDHQARVSR